jgi:hypothetical protein
VPHGRKRQADLQDDGDDVKKLKMWVAVDENGEAFGYEFKPRLCRYGSFLTEEGWMFHLGKLPSHAGQCWRQEIMPPPIKKKRRAKR